MSLLPGVLGAILKSLFEVLFSGETVETVSDTDGINGSDKNGGQSTVLTAEDMPAF